MRVALIVLGLLSATTVQAGFNWGLCDWGCVRFGVEADALYLRPMVDREKTAILSSSVGNPIGFQTFNELPTEWGFQVGASLTWKCDKRAAFRWFHLNSCHRLVQPVPTSLVLGVPGGSPAPWDGGVPGYFLSGAASSRAEMTWNAFEVDFHSRLICCRRYTLALSGGLHYVNVLYSATNRYEGITDGLPSGDSILDYLGSTRTFALGPKGGVILAGCLWWGWQLRGNANFGALVGRSSGRFQQISLGEIARGPFNITDQGTLQLFPEMNLRLGLEWAYTLSCRCSCWFEVGFETFHYWRVLRQPVYYDGLGRALSRITATSLNLAGLYVGGGVNF